MSLTLPRLVANQSQPEVIIDDAFTLIETAIDDAGGSINVREVGDSPAGDAFSVRELHFIGATVEPQTNGVALITISASGSDTGSDTGSDNMSAGAIGPSKAAALRLDIASPQTITSTPAAISWSSALFDNASFYDGSNPTRLTAHETGNYLLTATLRFSTTGQQFMYFMQNGAGEIACNASDGGSAPFGLSSSTIIPLTAGDYIELMAATASSSTTGNFSADDSTFCIVKLESGESAAAPITPDTAPSSPDAMDDEFEAGTLDPKWTWVNQNTASIVLANGCLVLTEQVNASEDVNFIEQALAGGSAWRYRAKLSLLCTVAYNSGGIILSESGTGKLLQFGLVNYNGAVELWVEYAASPTASGTISQQSGLSGLWPFGLSSASNFVYLEIELSSGTIYFRISPTGVDGTFSSFYSAAESTWFTTAADSIGLGGYSFNASTPGKLVVDWFRRMA